LVGFGTTAGLGPRKNLPYSDGKGVKTIVVPDPKPLRLALSESTLPELLFGALGMADVLSGFLVRPALLPRFAETANG
jgi:hypothetical protein